MEKLTVFGVVAGLSMFLVMSSEAIILSIANAPVPDFRIPILNGIVGAVLIGYGSVRFMKNVRNVN